MAIEYLELFSRTAEMLVRGRRERSRHTSGRGPYSIGDDGPGTPGCATVKGNVIFVPFLTSPRSH
jgi:hypothetical protein